MHCLKKVVRKTRKTKIDFTKANLWSEALGLQGAVAEARGSSWRPTKMPSQLTTQNLTRQTPWLGHFPQTQTLRHLLKRTHAKINCWKIMGHRTRKTRKFRHKIFTNK